MNYYVSVKTVGPTAHLKFATLAFFPLIFYNSWSRSSVLFSILIHFLFTTVLKYCIDYLPIYFALNKIKSVVMELYKSMSVENNIDYL